MEAGAADKQGECFVWGTGDAGQLGLGDDIVELSRPRLLSTLPSATPVLKVVCGGMHTVAIVQGGLVYSWGVNDEGALGRKASKEDENAESTPGLVTMPGSAAAVDVSTGDSHVAVATADGAVMAWGTFRSSSGLWAFTPTTQMAKTPVQCYTPEAHSVRPMTCDALHAVEECVWTLSNNACERSRTEPEHICLTRRTRSALGFVICSRERRRFWFQRFWFQRR